MDYGRESILRDDWEKIFDDGELDKVITRMLHLDQIERRPAQQVLPSRKWACVRPPPGRATFLPSETAGASSPTLKRDSTCDITISATDPCSVVQSLRETLRRPGIRTPTEGF